MKTIGDRAPGWAEDQELRAMPSALDAGLPALKEDAALEGEQCWAWPAPGEMEYVESAGRKLHRIYERKIQAARLDNVWRESLSAAAAVPFANEPTIEGWPPSIQPRTDGTGGFTAAVDDAGSSFHAYWAETFYRKLVGGIHYTLVDLPAEPGGSAYWVPIRDSQVLEVVTTLRDGKLRAVEARIGLVRKQESEGGEDPQKWGSASFVSVVRIYRVAQLFATTTEELLALEDSPVVFREAAKLKNEGGEPEWQWITNWKPLEARGAVPFTEIPLVPFYANRVAPYRGRPPFLDSASQQMSLWRKMLDYDERVRRDARNLIAFAGAAKGNATFDGNAYWMADKDAKAMLLETTGAALANLRDDHDVIRNSIRTANLRPVMSTPQPTRTATEIMVEKLGADSELEMWVLLDIASFRQLLQMTAALNGEPAEPGSVILPHDFGLDASERDMIWRGYIESDGVLVPPELAYAEMRRHQAISEKVNPKDVAAQVRAAIGQVDTTQTTAEETP
jgi:hypothetical protein